MSRSEFLQQLQEALANDLSGAIVQDNVDYYNQYIAEEVRSGKSEEEVLEMLGDPWILARSIIDSPEAKHQNAVYEPESEERSKSNQKKVYMFGSWWKQLLAIIVIILVIVLLISAVLGVVSLALPIILPVLLIVIVFRLLRSGRN